jgi:A/G-specific adenine glycosylase
MRELTRRDIVTFRRTVYDHYEHFGRSDLPWRRTKNPYHILVSEVMLQQTQVARVLDRYSPFLHEFPDVSSLAGAPLRIVLRAWSGLGYNRRALLLKRAAEEIVRRFGGEPPRTFAELVTLPGVGPATAGAICAFAFDDPHPFIETNIRAAYIHTFFQKKVSVTDAEVLFLVEQTLDRHDPRTWYYALMDYGVVLKKRYNNPSRRSAHHVGQGGFEGSDRQARGMIVKALAEQSLARRHLALATGLDAERLARNLIRLERDGLVVRRRGRYFIA